jgi:hypothetical protein
MGKVGQHSGEDLSGTGIFQMLVAQFNLLAGQDICAISEGEHPPGVEWVEIDLAAPCNEVTREIDTIDRDSGTGPDKDVKERQRQRESLAVLHHARKERVLVVIIIGCIAIDAEFAMEIGGQGTHWVQRVHSHPVKDLPPPSIE